MTSTGASLRSGDQLGSYQLLVPIGAGGMGRVWVARQVDAGPLARYVAIKTALAEDGSSEDFWRTLFDEARIASLLSHPNILTIHAVEHERGVHYLVMDYSDGVSLRELLDAMPGRRVDAHVGARIVARLCAGLHAAHELVGEDGVALGVVHRDVSPQNVLLASNGQVRLTDFGVARARGQLHAPTQTGEVKGKIAYMAPEQVTTKDIDRRVDVFAAGCVLYEATVGERPFQGGDALATLYQLLEEPIIPPSARAPGYPPGLEEIVLKAMERDRDNRYATAAEFNRALEGWLLTEKAMVTEGVIATVMKGVIGDRLDDRSQAIDGAIEAIEAGRLPSDSTPEPSASPSGGSKTLAGAALPETARAARSPKLALIVGGVALAAGAAFFFSSREETAPPPNPSAIPAPPAQPASTAMPTVEPVKSAEPTIEPAPAPSADGSDQEGLTISSRSPRRGPGRVVAPTPKAPTGDPAPQPSAAPAQPRAGELPTIIKKPIRTLDADNPFAPKP